MNLDLKDPTMQGRRSGRIVIVTGSMVACLCSLKARYVSGIALRVDGGMHRFMEKTPALRG